MQPFVHDDVPITGPVWLKSHAYVGPPGDGFMDRLRMTGKLNVPAEKLSDRKSEKNLSAFSERAQGNRTPNTGSIPTTRLPIRRRMRCRRCRERYDLRMASYPRRD